MEATEILDRLAVRGPLPIEAINAAKADRAAVVPVFLEAIERYLSEGGSSATQDALFFVFHLLGEWREQSAYRPLARLLRRPSDEVSTQSLATPSRRPATKSWQPSSTATRSRSVRSFAMQQPMNSSGHACVKRSQW